MNILKRIIILGGWIMLQSTASASAGSIYDFMVTSIDGLSVPMADYKGKVIVIVNTASKCGYTPQYEGLEALYAKYKSRGLVVLGFPSNDFGGQEPGTNTEIKNFCSTKFKVDFPMFAKGPVKGEQKQALFTFLTKNAPSTGEIKWNFEKFVIEPGGKIVGRFDSKVKPDDPAFISQIEKSLPH